jgi:hypothetical protein
VIAVNTQQSAKHSAEFQRAECCWLIAQCMGENVRAGGPAAFPFQCAFRAREARPFPALTLGAEFEGLATLEIRGSSPSKPGNT